MVVPWSEIPKESLKNLVEAFILREGTDYGAQEVSLSEKCEQVMLAIKTGQAYIVYDGDSESFDILAADQLSL